jgi:hypothetical protein
MVLGIQVIGIVFTLLMLYLTFLYYKKNNYTKAAFIFWVVVWVCALGLILFYQQFAALSERLEFARTCQCKAAGEESRRAREEHLCEAQVTCPS